MHRGSVILRDLRDEEGTRYLSAALSEEGNVVIEGQDSGNGVEKIFGVGIREYEWIWTILAVDVPALLSALEAKNDILDEMHKRFSNEEAAKLKPFLDDYEIPYQAWSRLGE